MSNNSEAPYPNYNAGDDYIERLGIEPTYHVNSPSSTRLNVLDEIADGKVQRGNYVFAKTDEQALEKGFDIRGDVDNIDDTYLVNEDNTQLRKLIIKTDSGTLPYYVRHTEIVPAGDEPSVEGVSRYVVDENLSFVEPGEGSSTTAPGTYLSLGESNLSPSYRFDPDSEKGPDLNESYLDSTGTATVYLMPVDTTDEDGNATHDWYWCTNPTAAAPMTNSYYYELPFELSPQTQYDSGKEVMYLMNTVLENAGLNDTNTEAEAHSSTTGLPNLKVAYQALRSEYIKALSASSSSTEKTALDPNITYGQLHDKLMTLLEGGTIAEGTIYEQTITAQTDDYSADNVPDLSSTGYWEAAHVSVLGIEYAFLSYLQGWPMDGMDVFQGGTNRIILGFVENNTRTYGARAMARILVAYAEAARDNGLLDSVNANATFDLTTSDVTRADGTTTVTVKPDTTNVSSLSFEFPSGVTVESMTNGGESVTPSSTSTDDSGVTTYTFSDSSSFPDTIELSAATTDENILRDDVLFTAVGSTKTVAKTFVNSNDLYQDSTTGHWVVREFVRANDPTSSSSSTDKTGQEMSQSVFKFTPEYQSLHARINLTALSEDTGSISVQKVWSNVDTDDRGTVEFTLYQNGTSTGRVLSLDGTADTNTSAYQYEDSAWHGVFTNLDKTDDNGDAYTYTVVESTDSGSWDLTDTQEATTYTDESTTVEGSYIGDATEISGSSFYDATITDEEATVVYCLDPTKAWPNNTTYSSKVINVMNDELQSLLSSSSSTLKDDLLSVIYNGYSTDAAGIQDTYGLTDTEFKEVTQAAVWRYVQPDTWSTAPSEFSTDMQQAFYALIGEDNTENVTLATPPDGYALTVYESSDSTYQDMLSAVLVTSDTWQFTNTGVDTYDIDFSKVDAGGNELSGASITILDSDGDEVASWTSTGENQTVSLEAGTYTFRETSAPDGYEAVTDITFTVSSDGTVTVDDANGNGVEVSGTTLIVTDEASADTFDIDFSKVDVGGNELSGAAITILDSDGNEVESWTSTGENETVSLEAGTYTFRETSAPDGYEAVTDITFTVSSDGTVTIDDANGNGVEVDGATVVVTDQATETFDIDFSKVDVGGNELSGAAIEILDSDGDVVQSWTSSGETETVTLEAGTYTFRETSAPDGYEAVTDITFTVSSDGSVTVDDANGNGVEVDGTTLIVTDQASTTDTFVIDFSKVDVDGNELSGAEIVILDSDGDEVASWTSTGENQTVSLEAGTYTFRETAAPDGYEAVTDITFTVSSDGSLTVDDANGNAVEVDGTTLIVTDDATGTTTTTTTTTSSSSTTTSTMPRTGDPSIALVVIMVALAGTGVVCIAGHRRKRDEK